jgi:dethiobiotin synthetase
VILFITGTGTEVGKTFVTAALARQLRIMGNHVVARKPVQSFEPDDTSTDADVLAAATGEDPRVVCPAHRWLATPMAPPMAAETLGLPPFTIADLASELDVPKAATMLVEGAGGVRSPLAVDGDNVDLADALRPDRVLLVADAGLGTINAVRLSADALRAHDVAVILNRYDASDPLHAQNAAWLREHDGCEVFIDVIALANDVAARR